MMQLCTLSLLLCITPFVTSAAECESESCPSVQPAAGASLIQTSGKRSVGVSPSADGDLQALQEQLSQLVQQITDKVAEATTIPAEVSSKIRQQIAAAKQKLEEDGDKIWELTPKEDLSKIANRLYYDLRNCRSSGKQACMWGHCMDLSDDQCRSSCSGSSAKNCLPGGWAVDGCTCDDMGEKPAQDACEGKAHREPCEFNLYEKTVEQKADGGNKSESTGLAFKGICDNGRCLAYKGMSCLFKAGVWHPAGQRCTNTDTSENSRSSGCCRINGKDDCSKHCSNRIEHKIYQLSTCVPKDGAVDETVCKPGYNPEWAE